MTKKPYKPLSTVLRVGRIISASHLVKICTGEGNDIRVWVLSSMSPMYMPVDRAFVLKRAKEAQEFRGKLDNRWWFKVIANDWLNTKTPAIHVGFTNERPKPKKIKKHKPTKIKNHAKSKNIHRKSNGHKRRSIR
jgi:hypothetical protein